MRWCSNGDSMMSLWRCDDVPMKMRWFPYEDAMMSLWRCDDVPMKMRWCPYENEMMSLWRCDDVPMKMRWCPYEDAMMFQWRLYDVPIKTHGITMLWCLCEDAWFNHVAMLQWCPVKIRLSRGRRKEDSEVQLILFTTTDEMSWRPVKK